jgi:hypothetical protein
LLVGVAPFANSLLTLVHRELTVASTLLKGNAFVDPVQVAYVVQTTTRDHVASRVEITCQHPSGVQRHVIDLPVGRDKEGR